MTDRPLLPGEVPAALTPVAPRDLYDAIERAWIAKFDTQPRRESLLVLLAQTTEECGLGAPYARCFNYGNVKHVEGDGFAFCSFRCNEVIDGKEVWFDPPSPACRFRAFPTLDVGVAAYLEILWSRFGRSWGAVLSGDPAAFARALKAQGYYSAAETLYESGLVRLYHQLDGQIPGGELPLDVAALQRALNAATPAPQPALVVDGDLGPHTLAAVKAFQAAHGLRVDGIVGPASRAALGL